ncbi:MAG: hypothetical protein JO358_18995 [Alphaproteobacteria bacterium]|nr:hypothetical protein [Alphaproteobacteria bacterium]
MRKILYAMGGFALLLNVIQITAYGDEPSTSRPERDTTTKRKVLPGTETMVASTFGWRAGRSGGYCSEYYMPVLQLVDPPKHGTVRFDTVLAIPKGSGCPNPVHGQGVFYRPSDGYTGQDQFTYYRPDDPRAFDWVGGVPPGNRTVIVTVMAR